MSAISTILLIPEYGDPLGLLANGMCGAQPPRAYRHPTKHTWEGEHSLANRVFWSGSYEDEGVSALVRAQGWLCALVLVYKGEEIWQAIDATDRALRRSTASGVVAHILIGGAAGTLMDAMPGAIVCLDADGREVSP